MQFFFFVHMSSPSLPKDPSLRDAKTFRKYLADTGINQHLEKAIAQLFERHEAGKDPEDPIEYVKRLISGESESWRVSLLSFSFFFFFLFFFCTLLFFTSSK